MNAAKQERQRVAGEAIIWMTSLQERSDESGRHETWSLDGLRSARAKALRVYVRPEGGQRRLFATIDLATGETHDDQGRLGAVRL